MSDRNQTASKEAARKRAVQRAREGFGDKVTRSGVRKLEEKGVDSKVINRAVRQSDNVGKGATKYVEKMRAGDAPAAAKQSRYVDTIGGSRVSYDPEKNRVTNFGRTARREYDTRAQRVDYRAGLTGDPALRTRADAMAQSAPRSLTKDSRKEVNQLLRQGYSFEAPDSKNYNTRNVSVTQRPSRSETSFPLGPGSMGMTPEFARNATSPGGRTRDTLTLYQTVGRKRDGRSEARERANAQRTSSSSSASASSGGTTTASPAAPAAPAAPAGQTPWSGSTEPPKPTMYGPNPTPPPPPGAVSSGASYAPPSSTYAPPSSTYWDSTPENLFNFSDRTGAYNRDMNQWMRNEADTDRRNQGTMLNQFASVLPPVESPEQANDRTLSFLERAQKLLKLV